MARHPDIRDPARILAPTALTQQFSDEVSAALEHATRITLSPFVHVQERPVIVLGNHKSGTSAIAGLLGALTAQTPALELRKELKRDKYREVHSGQMPFSKLVNRNKVDFSRRIIKENHFSTMPDKVQGYFPDSPIVMVTREPRDNIRSLLNRLRIPGDLEHVPDELWKTVPGVWKLVLDGRWLGINASTYVEQLALRWNLIIDHYLASRDTWILKRYEDFQADKIGELTRLARAVALKPVCDISDQLGFQFQPAGDSSVEWEVFFGERNLRTIERLCGSRMAALGYSTARDRRPVEQLSGWSGASIQDPSPS